VSLQSGIQSTEIRTPRWIPTCRLLDFGLWREREWECEQVPSTLSRRRPVGWECGLSSPPSSAQLSSFHSHPLARCKAGDASTAVSSPSATSPSTPNIHPTSNPTPRQRAKQLTEASSSASLNLNAKEHGTLWPLRPVRDRHTHGMNS
jgi:hypothetical protein